LGVDGCRFCLVFSVYYIIAYLLSFVKRLGGIGNGIKGLVN
jgi:hypothetical protein